MNKLLRRTGQNTAEYALLIALVVAGVIAMQTYAQRSLQARVRDAGIMLKSQTNEIGNSVQYEPYYLQTNYAITRNSREETTLTNEQIAKNMTSERTRGTNGSQTSTYTAPTGTNDGTEQMPSGI